MNRIEHRIIDRVLREPRRSHNVIVQGSTPVISFGDFTRSEVVTIGINPSSSEFLAGGNAKLISANKGKRLEDFESLGIKRHAELTEKHALQVWRGCQEYFAPYRNPYLSWFKHFDPILRKLNVSYQNGGAAHIDLVQWATLPAWSGMAKTIGADKAYRVQQELLADDLEFFLWQNAQPNVKVRLINGRTVLNQVKETGLFELVEDQTLQIETTNGYQKCQTYIGRGASNELVLGWSTNIQRLYGGNDLKLNAAQKIGNWVTKSVR